MPDDQLDQVIDEWFKEAVRSAYRPFSLGTFASALAAPGITDEALQELNASVTEDDAMHRIEILATRARKGDFSAAHPIVRRISAALAEPIPADSLQFAAVSRIIMEKLGEIEEARLQWALGRPDFDPSQPTTLPLLEPQSAQDEDTMTLVSRFRSSYAH